MSRQADEKSNRYRPNGAQKTPQTKTTKYVAFHPTKEEKEFLRDPDFDFEAALEDMVTYLRAGHKITIGHSPQTGVIYASLREKHDNWEEAITLSAFHSEAAMALAALCYFVKHKHPAFPVLETGLNQLEFEW